MSAVPYLDSTALNALEILYKKCKKQGVRLIFSHINDQPLKVMQKSGFYDMLGKENFCNRIDETEAILKKDTTK